MTVLVAKYLKTVCWDFFVIISFSSENDGCWGETLYDGDI